MEECRLQPAPVWEVGCGAGEILNQLYHRLPSSVSFVWYELSPQAFELCLQRQADRLIFRNENVPLPSTRQADLLLAIDVFEHVPDYLGFLRALKGVATHTIFHIPLELTVENILFGRTLLESRKAIGHLHFFDRGTALAALEDCGYTIIADHYTFWEGELPHRRPTSLLRRWAMRAMKRWKEHLAVRLLGGHSLLVVAR
jgi:SAM-dependent methyltransferase